MCIKKMERFTDRLVIKLRNRYNLNSTTTRWGVLTVFSTTSLGMLALSLSLNDFTKSYQVDNLAMSILNIIIYIGVAIMAIIGSAIGIGFIWWIIYFSTRNYTPTETEENIDSMVKNTKELVRSMNKMNTALKNMEKSMKRSKRKGFLD